MMFKHEFARGLAALSAVFSAALGFAAPASATEDDFNIWLGQFATIDAAEDIYVRVEAQ